MLSTGLRKINTRKIIIILMIAIQMKNPSIMLSINEFENIREGREKIIIIIIIKMRTKLISFNYNLNE